MFSVVGEGESSYSWKMEKRLFLVRGRRESRILAVALVGRRESLLSVRDRRDSFFEVYEKIVYLGITTPGGKIHLADEGPTGGIFRTAEPV